MQMFLAVTIALLASPVVAGTVRDCDDGLAHVANIAEPWVENTRSFANDAVRIAVLDLGEPAVGAMHLLVLTPSDDPALWRQCRTVSAARHSGSVTGFATLTLDEMQSDYDPDRGLMLTVNAKAFDPASGDILPRQLHLIINQSSGALIAKVSAP